MRVSRGTAQIIARPFWLDASGNSDTTLPPPSHHRAQTPISTWMTKPIGVDDCVVAHGGGLADATELWAAFRGLISRFASTPGLRAGCHVCWGITIMVNSGSCPHATHSTG